MLRNPSVPVVPSSPEVRHSYFQGACELKGPKKLEIGRKKIKEKRTADVLPSQDGSP